MLPCFGQYRKVPVKIHVLERSSCTALFGARCLLLNDVRRKLKSAKVWSVWCGLVIYNVSIQQHPSYDVHRTLIPHLYCLPLVAVEAQHYGVQVNAPSPPWSCCSRIQSLVFLFVSPVGQYVVSILTGFRRLLGGLYARAIMDPRRMYTVSLRLKEMTSLCISTCFWTGFYRYLIVFQHQHKSVLFFQIKKMF